MHTPGTDVCIDTWTPCAPQDFLMTTTTGNEVRALCALVRLCTRTICINVCLSYHTLQGFVTLLTKPVSLIDMLLTPETEPQQVC